MSVHGAEAGTSRGIRTTLPDRGLQDIHHVAAGASFAVGSSEFTVGGIYAFGSAPNQNTIHLIPDDDPDDETVPLPRELELRFRRLTFILGFSIGF